MVVQIIICLIVGYLFGSFCTGYLVGKMHHVNIQQEGSGNSGTTNALRTMGVKAALLTFVGDLLKVVIPVVAIRIIWKENNIYAILLALYLGFGAVLGHNFPVWLKFKGGKGIAVTAGVILAIADWRVTLIGLLLFILIVAVTRYVSVGSLVVAWLLPINTILFYQKESYFVHMLLISLCFTILAYVQHRSNIVRLLHGEEHKIGEKKNS